MPEQRYKDPTARARMAAGLCPECAGTVEQHDGWGGPRGCLLTDNGAANRIARQLPAGLPKLRDQAERQDVAVASRQPLQLVQLLVRQRYPLNRPCSSAGSCRTRTGWRRGTPLGAAAKNLGAKARDRLAAEIEARYGKCMGVPEIPEPEDEPPIAYTIDASHYSAQLTTAEFGCALHEPVELTQAGAR